MEAISLVARLRAFIIDRIKIKGILFPILLAFAFSASGETPLISDNSATVTDSGTRGICVLCSVSDVNHLVENSMQLNATFSLPVGVLGSAYACVGADRTFPAGRRAGFVASLNNGVASLLDGSTLTTRLGGSDQESLSGPGSLATVIGIGNDLNVVAEFTQPFDEICYEAASLLSLISIYRLNYAFVLESSASSSTISAQPESITANGTSESIITVQARDSLGKPVPGGGDTVHLSTTAGVLSAVSDHGDGTYTATLASSTTIETAEVSATINGKPLSTSVLVDFVADSGSAPDASTTLLSASPALVPADGSSSTTVTVQARDAFGNNLSTGGAVVDVHSTLGSVDATSDHGDGTYTATVSSTTPGSATITGFINSDEIAQTDKVVFYDPDAADAGTSTIDIHPPAITANGTAQATITIVAHNAAGQPLAAGGAHIETSTTAGQLSSSVVDHGDGRYTTLLTSSTAEETATVSARINGQTMTDTANVDFVSNSGGGAVAASSLLWASPTVIEASGSSTAIITVEARDAWGNPATESNDDVELETTAGQLGTVTGPDNGLYQAILHSASSPTTAVITGTLNNEAIGQSATVVFAAQTDADASRSTIDASPELLPADGFSTAVITVAAHDSQGNPLPIGGDDIVVSTTLGTLGTTVEDHGDGTYSVVLTAPDNPGVATISGTINGVPVSLTTEILFYDPNAADPDTTTISSRPAQISANGSAQSTITIEARNSGGDPTGAGGDSIALATTAGSLTGSIADHGNGIYTATLTSSINVETALVSATLNGLPVSSTTSVDFVDQPGSGDASPQTSRLWAAPVRVASDGSSAATLHVETFDELGNPVAAGGDSVVFGSSLGSTGQTTDHGDGTYSTSLTSTSPGLATVSGYLNSSLLAQTAVVEFASVAPDANAEKSAISAAPDTLPADGQSVSIITVQANDDDGNPLGEGGDVVTLQTTLGSLGTTVTDNGDGTYTGVLTAPAGPGTATITGTLNGLPIGQGATVEFEEVIDGIFHDRFEQ